MKFGDRALDIDVKLAPLNGLPCGRRAGKLYLPPHSRYFGCRRCHGLTYRSCQESHKFDTIYRMIAAGTGFDAATVKRMLKNFTNP